MTFLQWVAAYCIVSLTWVLCCYRYADSIPAMLFACLFWPLDFARVLCRGAREWWRCKY